MSTRLLDRQVSLLDYLTSSGAVFGDSADESINPALRGIDRGLLRLEACFSHEKRMEKIIAVFPRTFQILGASHAGIVREFVEVCPPVDISRVENARQFYNFLCTRWRHEPPDPAFLRRRRGLRICVCAGPCRCRSWGIGASGGRVGATSQHPPTPRGRSPALRLQCPANFRRRYRRSRSGPARYAPRDRHSP